MLEWGLIGNWGAPKGGLSGPIGNLISGLGLDGSILFLAFLVVETIISQLVISAILIE